MHPPSRKGILIILLAILLVVAVAVIPDIISDEMRTWCLKIFGDGYQKYMLGFFVVGSIVLLFLTTDIAKWLKPGTQADKPAPFNIPPGPKSRQVLGQAKKAIADAEPGEALRVLSELKLPEINVEIDLLSSRLVDYQRTRMHATEGPDTENQTFNKISRDTRDLIVILEKELANSIGNYDTIRAYLKKRYTNRLDQKLAKRQPVNLRRIPSTEGTSPERAATFVAYNSEEIGGTMAQIFREGRGRLLLLGAPGAGKTTLMLQLVLELLESEPESMPVLLNLATWNQDFINLDAWLKKILPAELGVSDRFATKIIQQNRLILLLDGFDEIKKKARVSCLDAIGRYGEEGQRRYAISSRKQEYFEVAKDAPVESQIEAGPLSIQQMEAELQRLWSDPVKPERGARMLWNAIQENELLRMVVETPFYFNALQILFSGSKTLGELQLTADSVEGLQAQITERFVEYELEGARAHYAPAKSTHWLSFFASRMNERNMVVFELRDLQYDWWRWNKLIIAQASLVKSLVSTIPFLILLFAYIIISGIGIYTEVSFSLFIGVISTFLSFELLNYLGHNNVFIHTFGTIKWSWVSLVTSIFQNFKIFIIIIFIVSLLNYHIMHHHFLNINIYAGCIFGVFLIVAIGLVYDSEEIIQNRYLYHHFISSAKIGYFSILQHKHLCYHLFSEGVVPPSIALFLNEMSRHHLLEFDGDLTIGTGGGSWRFRHRILQEYFALKWVEPEGKPVS